MTAAKPYYVYGMRWKMEVAIESMPDGFEEVHFYDEPADTAAGIKIYGEVVIGRRLTALERKKYGLVIIGAERRV